MTRSAQEHRVLRLALCLGVVLGALTIAAPEDASACSCAGLDGDGLREAIADSDAAFIGKLLKKTELDPPPSTEQPQPSGKAQFTFRVKERFNGRLGKKVKVESASDGAACGLEVRVGQHAGLLLDRRGGRWTSSLCSQFPPDEMRRAAAGLSVRSRCPN